MERRMEMDSERMNRVQANQRRKTRTLEATSRETKMFTFVPQSNKTDCTQRTESTTATPSSQVSITQTAASLNIFASLANSFGLGRLLHLQIETSKSKIDGGS